MTGNGYHFNGEKAREIKQRLKELKHNPRALAKLFDLKRDKTLAASWLADVLRAAGCSVEEIDGWQTRGRPGTFGPVKGVLCHHTAGPLTGNAPSLQTILNGRPDLAGPLAHTLLARDGTFMVIAAGRCNHAGVGSWQGITSGNTYFIGIEAENTGLPNDPWPDVQYEAYAKGCAAILDHIGAPVIMCAGHKEYALPPGRKCDPSFNMPAFRADVAKYMTEERS